MQYKVIGDTMPAVEVVFDAAGESIYTQSGGMAWMSEGVTMDSNMKGGLGKVSAECFPVNLCLWRPIGLNAQAVW